MLLASPAMPRRSQSWRNSLPSNASATHSWISLFGLTTVAILCGSNLPQVRACGRSSLRSLVSRRSWGYRLRRLRRSNPDGASSADEPRDQRHAEGLLPDGGIGRRRRPSRDSMPGWIGSASHGELGLHKRQRMARCPRRVAGRGADTEGGDRSSAWNEALACDGAVTTAGVRPLAPGPVISYLDQCWRSQDPPDRLVMALVHGFGASRFARNAHCRCLARCPLHTHPSAEPV